MRGKTCAENPAATEDEKCNAEQVPRSRRRFRDTLDPEIPVREKTSFNRLSYIAPL